MTTWVWFIIASIQCLVCQGLLVVKIDGEKVVSEDNPDVAEYRTVHVFARNDNNNPTLS